MAKRLILALLALLTGLTAASGPSVARIADRNGAQVGSVAAPVACDWVAVRSLSHVKVRSGPTFQRKRCAPLAFRAVAVPVAAVLPGIDRARE